LKSMKQFYISIKIGGKYSELSPYATVRKSREISYIYRSKKMFLTNVTQENEAHFYVRVHVLHKVQY
jgi:hypothetical protein